MLMWKSLKSFLLWNGVGIGYEIQYKLKSAPSDSWQSVLRFGDGKGSYSYENLQKFTPYQFKVAARTIKGSGPFSSIIEQRTMEDGTCCTA